MTTIYLLIGASFLVALIFLFAFIWALRSGQFDDDYTPSVRMLFDSKIKSKTQNSEHECRKI